MTTIIGIEPGDSLLCVTCHDRLPVKDQDECSDCLGDEQHFGECYECGREGKLAVFPDGEYDSDGCARDCSTRVCLGCGSKDVIQQCGCNLWGTDHKCRRAPTSKEIEARL